MLIARDYSRKSAAKVLLFFELTKSSRKKMQIYTILLYMSKKYSNFAPKFDNYGRNTRKVDDRDSSER